MANRIAVSADTIATITSTSASIANRSTDFMSSPVPGKRNYSLRLVAPASRRPTSGRKPAAPNLFLPQPLSSLIISITYGSAHPRSLQLRHPPHSACNLNHGERSTVEVRHDFFLGVSCLRAAFDPGLACTFQPVCAAGNSCLYQL